MDNLVFEEAVNSTIDQSEFISKKWVYVNDNNSQNYSSQIVLDTTPLSNAGGWVNWQEAYMVLPLVVQLTSADVADIPVNSNTTDYAWAFKSGFWHMINSMNVEFNNQNIIQQTPLTNVFRSFKANTSFSQDDLLNEGSSLGFYPDNAGSWSYNKQNVGGSLTFADGVGLCNNKDAPIMYATTPASQGLVANGASTSLPVYSIVTSGVAGQSGVSNTVGGTINASGTGNPSEELISPYSHNNGLTKRQTWYGYDGSATQSDLVPIATASSMYRSCKVQSIAGSATWHVYAKLRLKDLNEYFEKCPLLKGSTIRFYINTNQSLIKFSKTDTTLSASYVPNGGTVSLTSVQVIGGQTCPLMIASTEISQGLSPLPAGSYMLSCSIFKNTFSEQLAHNANSGSPPQTGLTAVRLYAPVYQFNPLAQQRYLQLAPTKKVVYRDIFQYQFSEIAPDANFNFLVSNGIPNIKSVLIVPYIPGGYNGSYTDPSTGVPSKNGLAYSTLLSPFCSSPAMPDPIPLSNINILVSGVNLFLNNQLYDYEQFRQELMSSNQLNGNLTTGLTSGLISEEMFSRGYRYYYGNCSRILPAEAGVSRSVQIIGQNKSLATINILVYVEFEKEMTIDIATGARID
jgi:hypothetical protein